MKKASMESEHDKFIKKTNGSTLYNVMTHLKKILSPLSVYDALCMLPQLKASLIYALNNLEKFSQNYEIASASW